MKLVGVDDLNLKMRNALILYGAAPADVTMEFSNDFYAYNAKHVIGYTVLKYEHDDDEFLKWCKILFQYEPYDEIDDFLLALLHEVGHLNTYGLIPEEAKQEDKINRQQIEEAIKENKGTSLNYYSLPLERWATKWATDFIKKNKYLYWLLKENVIEILDNFYSENTEEIGD